MRAQKRWSALVKTSTNTERPTILVENFLSLSLSLLDTAAGQDYFVVATSLPMMTIVCRSEAPADRSEFAGGQYCLPCHIFFFSTPQHTRTHSPGQKEGTASRGAKRDWAGTM